MHVRRIGNDVNRAINVLHIRVTAVRQPDVYRPRPRVTRVRVGIERVLRGEAADALAEEREGAGVE